jgi:hypothetical protein
LKPSSDVVINAFSGRLTDWYRKELGRGEGDWTAKI